MRRTITVLIAVVLATWLVPAPASAQDGDVVAAPGSFRGYYLTPVTVVSPDGALTFTNLDVAPHNVVARDATGPDDQPWCGAYDPGTCPLFWSQTVSFDTETPVLGLENTEPGVAYGFYCTIHPLMSGQLLVVEGDA